MNLARIIPLVFSVGIVGCEFEPGDDTWLGLQPAETESDGGDLADPTDDTSETDETTDDTTDTGEPESSELRIVMGGDGSPFVDGTLNTFGGGSFDGLVVSIHIDETSSYYEWKRYHGADKNESVRDLDIDANGRICGSGWTNSSNLSTTTGAVQAVYGGGTRDLYLGCWSATGGLLYSSYFGGKLAELNQTAISLADDGSLVVAGGTNSINLATTAGTVQPVAPAANNNGLVFTFGPSGSPITWGSYLGGAGVDAMMDNDLGADGDIWMIGDAMSANFPVTDGSTLKGPQDSVVARVSPDGTTLELGTLLGGSANDYGVTIAALPDGTAITCGHSYSNDFPTTLGAVQATHAPQLVANFDVVVSHVDSDGTVLAATYLGGAGFDACLFLDVDDEGNVYVAGWTDDLADFPLTTSDSLFGAFNLANQLGFLAKLDPDLETLEYAVRTDIARAMDVLDDGRVVLLAATDPGLSETPNAIPGESGNVLIVYEQDGVTAEYLGYVMGEGMFVEVLRAVEI